MALSIGVPLSRGAREGASEALPFACLVRESKSPSNASRSAAQDGESAARWIVDPSGE